MEAICNVEKPIRGDGSHMRACPNSWGKNRREMRGVRTEEGAIRRLEEHSAAHSDEEGGAWAIPMVKVRCPAPTARAEGKKPL